MSDRTAYDWLRPRLPMTDGQSIMAILDADGHVATCPVSPELLDDEGMDEVALDVMSHLLPSRRLSRVKNADR